ncbi:hypothetical protein [Amphritea japonica]|uniref:Electron transfer flavoprotein alpha/beta-subunit N-terminal domain-containing protein n=1 Tax=Amphritea japonica ATCC BAA-1530 TaxID=1278309 RepID=A0A7R6P4M9_9GAMM|nr:hypothetical protein [Amphritea japonica]BBB27094.1 hypothetical protein AMJAP_2505 [Amphritea japonica ATCC BAA-1530]
MKVTVILTPGSSGVKQKSSGEIILDPQALESINEALQLKRSGRATEVTVVTLGQSLTLEQSESLLQQGIDRKRFVPCEVIPNAMELAEVLLAVVHLEKPDLILIGRRQDKLQCQLGNLLAELLEFRSSQTEKEGSQFYRTLVIREIGSGVNVVTLPAMSADKGLVKDKLSRLQVA